MVPENLFHLGLCYVAGVSGLDPASRCSDLLLSLPGWTLSPRCRQPASGPDSRVHLRPMQQVFLSPGWTPDLARYFSLSGAVNGTCLCHHPGPVELPPSSWVALGFPLISPHGTTPVLQLPDV